MDTQNNRFSDQFIQMKTVSHEIELYKAKNNNEAFKVTYTKNNSIWIFYQNTDIYSETPNTGSNVAYILSYYLKLLEDEFLDIFKYNGINPDIEFYIYPIDYFEKNLIKKFPNFQLNSNLNFKIDFIRENRSYKITVVYLNSFKIDYINEKNECERYIIKKLVESLFYQFCFDMAHDNIQKNAQFFIDETIPYGKRHISYYQTNERFLEYKDPIPTSNGEFNFDDLLNEALKKNQIKPGLYKQKELNKILQKMYNFIQLKLESEIKRFNKELITFIYTQIEFLTHQKNTEGLLFGQTAHKNKDNLNIIDQRIEWFQNLITRNLALRHLIETSLRVCPKGEECVDVKNFQYLEDLSNLAILLASISDNVHFNLQDFCIRVHGDHSFNLYSNDPIRNNEYLSDYNHMALEVEIQNYKFEQKSNEETLNGDLSSEYSSKLPKHYMNLDKAFKEDFGFKYADFIITLACLTCINTSTPLFDPLICLDEESLIKQLIKFETGSEIDSLTIKKILDFISINTELLTETETLIPSGIKMNRNRFAMNPLIKFKDLDRIFYLYGIASVEFTAITYGKRISEGRFPYKLKNEKKVSNEINLIKKSIETKLEQELDQKLCELLGNKNVESRLSNFHRIDRSLQKNPECGEIDSLAVDKNNKIIHVFEAKYVKTGIVPQEIKHEIKKFYSDSKTKKDYSKMLLKKCNFVSKNIDYFLKHFKVENSEGWETKPVFITYETHISGYIPQNKIEFVRLSQLEKYLGLN